VTACKDPDPFIPSALKASTVLTPRGASVQLFVDSNGNYTKQAINQMAFDIAGFGASNKPINVVAKAVEKYGEQLYTQLNNFNNTFIKEDYIVKELPKFEYLGPRLQKGPLTDIEFASFLESQGYTPFSFGVATANNSTSLLEQLDGFFSGGFALAIAGGLCGTLPNIFGAINSFFDKIGQVGNLLNDALSFLSKLKNIENPLEALFEKIKVKALIEAIKDKLIGMFEAVVKQVEAAIRNFDLGSLIEGIVGPSLKGITRAFIKIRDKALAFFEKTNIQSIKDKLTALFDYAVGLFANPGIGEIQFLISRFCGLLTGVEEQVTQVKQPLTTFADDLRAAEEALTVQGNAATAQVIAANGTRTPPEVLEERINNQQQLHRERVEQSINDSTEPWQPPQGSVPEGVIETSTLPPADPNNVDGSVRPVSRPRSYGDRQITPDDVLDVFPTFDDLINNRNRYIWIDPVYSARALYGNASMRENGVEPHYDTFWTMTGENERVALMRTLIEWDGPKVQLVSGYRSPAYNRYLRDVVRIPNVAINSLHTAGIAFDLDWPTYPDDLTPDGLNNRSRLMRIAQANGFWGLGVYTPPGSSFLHIDHRDRNQASTWYR
jgi:hypothetical protein